VRAIARAAGVDAALVHHYFGTKEQVFVAAMHLPFTPAEALPSVLDGPVAQVGERLCRLFLSLWSDPAFRDPMLGMLRSATTSEQGATMLREFVGRTLLGRVAAHVDVADAPLRVSLSAAHMVGVAVLRYVIRVEPLTNATDDEIVAIVAPTLQRYLTGELDERTAPRHNSPYGE
jgi:AcrR family transcriptional regulator